MALAWLISAAWNDSHPSAPVPKIVTEKKLQDCRDQCEQTAIVEQLAEDVMRACRARCVKEIAPPRPHEVPRRITVAPGDHSRTIRSEK
jgi:hypothetical protein